MNQGLTQNSLAADSVRPHGGWLKSIRTKQGISLRTVAERLGVSPQAVHQFEKSEAAGTISLRQLENVARAMGCRVVYALRPVRAQPQPRQRTEAEPVAPVTSVEHSILLDNQAADRFD